MRNVTGKDVLWMFGLCNSIVYCVFAFDAPSFSRSPALRLEAEEDSRWLFGYNRTITRFAFCRSG